MNLDGRQIWQVACGDGNRDYADVLLKWDIVAVGPGHFGPWPECRNALTQIITARKIQMV